MIPGWPPLVYIALFTNAPSCDGTEPAIEVDRDVWTNYRRVVVPNDTAHWSCGENYQSDTICWNAQVIDFGVAAIIGTSPTIVAYGVMPEDGSSVILCGGPLLQAFEVTNGSRPMFQVGTIIVGACDCQD